MEPSTAPLHPLTEATASCATTTAGALRDGEPALPRGTEVGRYLILEGIGSGGMGLVYAAYDPELDRKIAIKILRVRYWGEDGRARALSEAQALAQLTHANVVRVYDVGEMGDQLFQAMELVEGHPLPQWLESGPRTWREIVNVMVQAGRGLQAAHDAGIVHRDVKPANILVPRQGEARIADFGVAAADETRTEEVVGTPVYMAPEQQQGAATAKSDQFSFCVSAWEALYGYRPTEHGGVSSKTSDQTTSDSDRVPPRPRKAHASDKPPRWVRRVLAAGMSAEPHARAADMQALLDQLAPPPQRRARKMVWAAASLTAVSMGILAAVLWTRTPVTERCDHAADAVGDAWNEHIRVRIAGAFTATQRGYAGDTADRVLARFDARAQAWAERKRHVCRATWERGEQSEQLLDLRMACLDRRLSEMASLAHVYTSNVDAAMVDRAVDAVSALPPLSDCDDIDPSHAALEPAAGPAVAQVAALRQRVDEMRALTWAGRFADAVDAGKQIAADADALAFAPVQADAYVALGLALSGTSDLSDAEAAFARAAVNAARARDDRIAAVAAANLVWVVGYRQDRRPEGRAMVPLADAAVERAGNEPLLRAELLSAIGAMHMGAGEYTEARAHMERALELYLQRWGADDPRLGKPLNNVGLAAVYEEKFDVAIGYLERARDLWSAEYGPDHPQVALALNNLGMAQVDAKRYDEAIASYRRALDIWERALGPDHADVAMVLVNLGVETSRGGNLVEAQRYYERALKIRERKLGPTHQKTGVSIHNVASILTKRGKHAEALPLYERALAIFSASLPDDHQYVVVSLIGAGSTHTSLGAYDVARPLLERALVAATGKHPDFVPEIQLNLARALWPERRSRRRARALAQQAHDAWAADPAATSDAADAARWLSTHR